MDEKDIEDMSDDELRKELEFAYDEQDNIIEWIGSIEDEMGNRGLNHD